MRTLARHVGRLEQRAAAKHPASVAVSHQPPLPEQQEEVLAILLEAGVLRLADDGTLQCLAAGGEYVPWSHSPQ